MSRAMPARRALHLALLLAAGCQRGPSDAEAEAVVRRYAALVADAYRTGDVRVAYEVSVRMLPWPSSPLRASAVTGTRRNSSP